MHDAAAAVSERLRQTYTEWNNPPSAGLPDGAKVLLDAADEIDRLRASQAGGVPAGLLLQSQETVDNVRRDFHAAIDAALREPNGAHLAARICQHVFNVAHGITAASPPPPATDVTANQTRLCREGVTEDERKNGGLATKGVATFNRPSPAEEASGDFDDVTPAPAPNSATDGDALREALAKLLTMRSGVEADVRLAHRSRGNGVSQWMTEDDREFRKDLGEAFDAAEAALASSPPLAATGMPLDARNSAPLDRGRVSSSASERQGEYPTPAPVSATDAVEAEQAIRADEREACALVAEREACKALLRGALDISQEYTAPLLVAAAIRARGTDEVENG